MSAAPTPRTRLSPDERRVAIAAAARAIALDEGLVGVTQRGVAAAAGVTPALVAHYAPGMDELVADTFDVIVNDELRDVAALVSAIPDARGRLRALLATVLDGSRDDVTLVWVHAWAAGARNEALAARVRAAMDAWQELIVGVVGLGVSRGEWASTDADEVAWLVLGLIDGLNAQSLVRWRGRDAAEASGRRRLAARAIEGVLGIDRGALD